MSEVIDSNEYDEVFVMSNYKTVKLEEKIGEVAYLIDGFVFMLDKVEVGGVTIPQLRSMNMTESEKEALIHFCIDNGHEEYEASTEMREVLRTLERSK